MIPSVTVITNNHWFRTGDWIARTVFVYSAVEIFLKMTTTKTQSTKSIQTQPAQSWNINKRLWGCWRVLVRFLIGQTPFSSAKPQTVDLDSPTVENSSQHLTTAQNNSKQLETAQIKTAQKTKAAQNSSKHNMSKQVKTGQKAEKQLNNSSKTALKNLNIVFCFASRQSWPKVQIYM